MNKIKIKLKKRSKQSQIDYLQKQLFDKMRENIILKNSPKIPWSKICEVMEHLYVGRCKQVLNDEGTWFKDVYFRKCIFCGHEEDGITQKEILIK